MRGILLLQWEVLEAAAAYLEPTREAEDAAVKYEELDSVLDEYIRKIYSDWIVTIESGMLFIDIYSRKLIYSFLSISVIYQ